MAAWLAAPARAFVAAVVLVGMLVVSAGVAAAVPPPLLITMIAGYGYNSIPGLAKDIGLQSPRNGLFDAAGNYYFVDTYLYTVNKITPDGHVSVVAGTGTQASSTAVPSPGPATSTDLYYPTDIARDAAGNMFIIDGAFSVVMKVDTSGQLTVIAGTGNTGTTPAAPGTPALSADLRYPEGLALDSAGNLYISDMTNVVYKMNTSGLLTVVAGNGQPSGGTAPPAAGVSVSATSVQLDEPVGMTVDATGNLYIADSRGHRVEKVTPAGQLSTFAGTGASGAPTAGPATSSPLGYPSDVAVDQDGDVAIADGDGAIVLVNPAGQLSFLAGNGTIHNPTFDGPAATSAVGGPSGVVFAADGAVIFTSYNYSLIARIGPAKTPSAPIAATVSAGSSPGTLDVTFDLPVYDGGSPITSYQASTDGGTTWSTLTVTGTTTLSATLSGLVGGVSVPVRFRALNAIGNGTAGTAVSATVPGPTAPGAPAAVTAVAGVASATVTFGPTPTGGSAITSYTVTASPGGATTTGTSSPITVAGLTNGTAYTFTVHATNSIGTGPGATTTVPVTPLTPPPAPPGVTPTPIALFSTGAGTTVQHVTVNTSAGDTLTLLDAGQPASTITRPGVGTYTLNPATKTITFTPVPGYVGTPAPVTFKVTTTANLSGTATYTATVTKPAAPTPAALTSTGPGTQHATITHHEGDTLTLLDSAGTPTTAPVTITGEGTYTLDPATGAITFTPAAGFTGTGVGVGFQITDAYDQTAMAAYVPTIGTSTPTPTPKPAPKPLPKIDRTDLVKIPANPKKITGKERTTKAFNSSFTGIDAHPIVKLGTRQLKKGQATTLSGDGLFDFDSAKLTKKGRAQVKAVVFNLKGSKSVKCEGYTDYAGARDHELDLSAGRAKAVCTALKMYGAKVTTKTKGYGPQRPVVVGGTAKGRKENRRVVILITR